MQYQRILKHGEEKGGVEHSGQETGLKQRLWEVKCFQASEDSQDIEHT